MHFYHAVRGEGGGSWHPLNLQLFQHPQGKQLGREGEQKGETMQSQVGRPTGGKDDS
jgi:hypothetical protein